VPLLFSLYNWFVLQLCPFAIYVRFVGQSKFVSVQYVGLAAPTLFRDVISVDNNEGSLNDLVFWNQFHCRLKVTGLLADGEW